MAIVVVFLRVRNAHLVFAKAEQGKIDNWGIA